jgi:hypothetical protein
MLKQSSSIKKGIAVSLAVLFVVSLTAVAASVHGWRSGWGRPGWATYPYVIPYVTPAL